MDTDRPQISPTEGYGYRDISQHPAVPAARVVVDLLRQRLSFTSVLDVGCGVGIWLSEFQRQGITEVFGLDGAWVPHENLLISKESFRTHNLATPFQLGRQFDLVLCLEVAEHLPATAADSLLDSLVAHGSIIIFSAAIPGQGGFQHVNEQFQDYWIERFKMRGFAAYDVLRPTLWKCPEVPYYYAQNVLVYSKTVLPYPSEFIPAVVHPELYARRTDPRHYSLKAVFRNFPGYAMRVLRSFWRRK